MVDLHASLKQLAIRFHISHGITVCNVQNAAVGTTVAEKILYSLVDKKTVLYLSGGSTPRTLYTFMAKHENLQAGAVGLVDERYGEKFHKDSNELMIQKSQLLRYLHMLDVPFYPILGTYKDRQECADAYDEKMRELNAIFPKSISILGIGADGHISSIAPNTKSFTNPMFDRTQQSLLVSAFDDPERFYGERVGMTFTGLSMMDVHIVLIFGDSKRDALDAVFTSGSEEDIPARFLTRPDIAKRTLFITDQNV